MLLYVVSASGGFGVWVPAGYSAADADGPTWLNGVITPHGWRAAISSVAFYGAVTAAAVFAGWRVSHRLKPTPS
jgi:hypothetical protein